MKTGKTLQQLAQELERIQAVKQDFIVPVSKLEMKSDGNLAFKNGVEHSVALNNWSSGQVASFTDIPKAYFDRIRAENPALLSQAVNHEFGKRKTEKRLIRTIDGNARAFLSNSYRILDSHELLEVMLPALLQNEFQVLSSEITEKRLYLKAVSPKVTGEVMKGDVVQYGVAISTSDVGAGSLKVEPFIHRLVCLNGMISSTSFKKAHLGSRRDEREVFEIMTDDTKRLNDQAFFATVKDYFNATMSPEMFQKEIAKLQAATAAPIKNFDLDQVVTLAMNETGVRGEGVKNSILAALASGNEGAGLTKWGLANSFTRAAQSDALDYDTATDLERAGGLIVDLNATQWRKVAEVA